MNDHALLSRRELFSIAAAVGGTALLGAPRFSLGAEAAVGADAVTATLEKLREALRGDLITAADPSYDAARKLWNGMIDKRPLAIVRCTGVADVMAVVNHARDARIPVTVRGGGHNVAGKALSDGAIAIDLSPMRGIRVDPRSKRARAAGGVLWGEFDRETLSFDLACTGGTVASTGIAGLTLGGGLGWLMRKHGLSCDNLVSADVVTADGRALTASADRNPDLFWALRGGGGNFGVVTSFEYGLHELEPIVGGMAMYPENMVRDLLHFYRDYTNSAPDSVTTMAGVMIGPEASPLEGQHAGWVALCHCGPESDGEKLVKPFKDFGPPAMDFIGPTTYAAMQNLFAAAAAPGLRNYWRSNFIAELSDEVIETMLARADQLPKPGTLLLLEHLDGAVGRVDSQATAFSNRWAKHNISILSSWVDPAHDEPNIAWTREFGNELRAFSTGAAYVNYMTADESAERVRATYEANLDRLRAVKRKYDPDNFFSGNQNIAPRRS